MPSRFGDAMARIGGGDKTILAEVPQDRARFTQMAGVLFTTAGVAVLSMTFALHNGVHAPLYAAVILGLAWGVVIFNLDRFLVLSMGDTRTRGWRLFGIMLPRFVLAALLAAVVSTPLVLRIFASDINEQLANIHQVQSRHFLSLLSHSADANLARKLKAEIKADNRILNGHVPIVNKGFQGDESLVQSLTKQLNADFKTRQAAYEKWQCELNGQTCGGASGKAGNGGRAHTDHVAYLHALAAYDTVKTQLQDADRSENKARTAFQNYSQKRVQQAQSKAHQALPGLTKQYKTVEARIQQKIKNDDSVNTANTGILAQLQALSQASATNSSLEAARWTVLALFFVIEILPVTVKALLNLGSQTAYEKVVIGREIALSDREEVRRIENRRIEDEQSQARIKAAADRIKMGDIDAETKLKIAEDKAHSRYKVQQDMREREQDIGTRANEYVQVEMTKIIDSALHEWGERVRATLLNGATKNTNGQESLAATETEEGYELPPDDLI